MLHTIVVIVGFATYASTTSSVSTSTVLATFWAIITTIRGRIRVGILKTVNIICINSGMVGFEESSVSVIRGGGNT